MYPKFIAEKEEDLHHFIEYVMDEIYEHYEEIMTINVDEDKDKENNRKTSVSINTIKDLFFYLYYEIIDDFSDFFGEDNDEWSEMEIVDILQHCFYVFLFQIKEPICFDSLDTSISSISTDIINVSDLEQDQEQEQKIEKYKKQIEYLLSIPQPQQRTQEWYQYRYNLITASNAYKALGSQALQNSLIYEKCQPLVQLNQNADKTEMKYINTKTTLHWGQKYEPLSVMIYEQIFQTKIQDFGCIQHPNPIFFFIGASPDGINMDENNPKLYGRMLEIKNIVNRPITGIPKHEYAVQMQMQMEVCDLNECDFLETKFKEFQEEHEFYEDIAPIFSATSKKTMTTVQGLIIPAFYGCIMQLQNVDSPNPTYIYFICDITGIETIEQLKQSIMDWESVQLNKVNKQNEQTGQHVHWTQTHYWKLEILSCVCIDRDKSWFQFNKNQFESIWKTIEKERQSGYEHRAPIKRVLKSSSNTDATNKNINNKPFLFSLTKQTTLDDMLNNTKIEKIISVDLETTSKMGGLSSKKNQKPKFDMSVFAFTDIEKTE